MNIFTLVLKQMRQRALSTTLTVMSVALGVALAIAIYLVSREGQEVFAQTDYGYELVVGPKGSGTELVLNSVYHIGVSQGNIPYALYEDMAKPAKLSAFGDGKLNQFRGKVQWAVPLAVGDSYKQHPIVATTPNFFGAEDDGKPIADAQKWPEYRLGKHFEFSQGRAFAGRKFEAVIGAQTAIDTGLKVGMKFQATHGFPDPSDTNPDIHPEEWTVVGVLAPTHTANDRCLFIPLPTFYAIFEHEEGLEKIQKTKSMMPGAGASTLPASETAKPATSTAASEEKEEHEEKAYTVDAEGNVTPNLPKREWEVSSVLVKTWGGSSMEQMRAIFRSRPESMAVNPASTMAEFFNLFLKNIVLVLLLASLLVIVVAAVSILVSIYSAVTSRSREIAILRALGATRMRILSITCMEAGFGGLLGGVLGLIGGHALGAIGSAILEQKTGQGIPWWRIDMMEWFGLAAVVAIAMLAGLVPALKAYRVSVAENLTI